MKRILTGIRPTGNLHLGHLIGTVNNWIKLQNDYDMFLEIANVQALTDNFDDPEKVRINTKEIILDLLGAGIDPEKVTIFIQSEIPEIAEATVFYSNLVTMARLYRNPTVKTEIGDKKNVFGESGERVTYGFVGYPVSQAADITIFKGELVPVGEDQLPLIEQCREIVKKFNNIYGETLIEPKELLSETPRIKGIDGNEKMGKSLGNAIYLVDDLDTISKKIMSAVTDPSKIKKDDPANPEQCMVYYYHKVIKNDNLDTICGECKKGERGCVQCKKELITKMMEYLEPIKERRKYYEEHPQLVNEIINKSNDRAKEEARKTMLEIKEKMKINY